MLFIYNASSLSTAGSLTQRMRDMYKVTTSSQVKLLGSYMSANYDELSNDEETLSQANLQPRQFVVIVEKEGAVWPDPDNYKKTTATSFTASVPKPNASNGAQQMTVVSPAPPAAAVSASSDSDSPFK